MKGDVQYIADTFLIERMFQVLAELEDDNDVLKKQAFDLGSVLGSIAGSIKQFVGSQIHGQDSGGVTRTVVNFLAPAMFFRLHPILGIIVTGAQLFGFDLYSVYQTIINAIMPSIQAGEQVTAQQVNDAAKSAIPQVQEVQASDDLLYSIREMHKQGSLTKEGIGSSWQNANRQNPFLPKNTNPLLRMVSFLGPRRGSSLIVGILVWFLKTVLLSAGLLAAGGVATSALGLGSSKEKPSYLPQSTSTEPTTTPAISSIPSPTGGGGFNYRPNKGDIWIENLGSQKPHERIMQWVIESYPDLNQYKDIVLRTPSFWSAVRGLTQDWPPGQGQWAIPEPYKTRNEILAMFVPDVYREITRGLK